MKAPTARNGAKRARITMNIDAINSTVDTIGLAKPAVVPVETALVATVPNGLYQKTLLQQLLRLTI